MGDWTLAIDFGTTSTVVAIRDAEGVQLVDLAGQPRMASMVFWRESGEGQTGCFVQGAEAERLAISAPWCFERPPKRDLDDEFLLLGAERVRVTNAIAAVLRHAADEAMRCRGGEAPAETWLTLPAHWGTRRLGQLRRVAE